MAEENGNEKRENPVVEANFLQFLSGMGAQTLMHLGVMSNPMTGKTEADLVQAKYSIDLLAIFQEKTKGNLSGEEEEYLAGMLSQLRMAYVDAANRPKEESDAATEQGSDAEKADGDDSESEERAAGGEETGGPDGEDTEEKTA